jgi:diacylglycerol kinase (ATP)
LSAAKVCVIYNPAAGRGRASQRLESLRGVLGSEADFQATKGPGHAEELATQAAANGFATIGAAGGDGTVHDVANGILRAGRSDITLAVYPVGSANDYAHSLGLGSQWWLSQRGPSATRSVDIGLVQCPGGRQRYFVNGIGIGFNGSVTLESERVRRFQGVFLYTLALLRAVCFRYTFPLVTATIDGSVRQVPTLAFSVAIGRREGNFVLAPDAQVDDGLFNYLHVGKIPRWELIRYVPGMITGNLPTNHPALWTGLCREVTVHSDAPLPVHLDGEMFSRPSDDVRDLDIRILPGGLRVLKPGPVTVTP